MIIDYNMSREYCSDWTAIEALREIVQNALDSNQEYSCTVKEQEISVLTYNVTLPPEVFSMGVSVKGGNDAIGKYGEGFKIAMLVLTRLGLQPIIQTGNYIVTGTFREHEFTGIETFCLEIVQDPQPSNNTIFLCRKDGVDLDDLRTKVTPFADGMPLPSKIDIKQSLPGMIYVNGLFVAKEDLVFGYNFAPNQITLNRDRNMVNGVHWQLAGFYGNLGKKHAETIFNLVERDAPDVRDLNYRLHNSELKSELVRLFYNKYGDGAKIAKPGTTYIGSSGSVSCSTTASSVYGSCGIKEAVKTVDPEAPDQVLRDWVTTNKRYLRRDVRVSLDKVITRSKGWTKAGIM